jgi:hypothetical protein
MRTAVVLLVAVWALFIGALLAWAISRMAFDSPAFEAAMAGPLFAGLAIGLALGYIRPDMEEATEASFIVGGGVLVFVTLVGSYLLFPALAAFGAGVGLAAGRRMRGPGATAT